MTKDFLILTAMAAVLGLVVTTGVQQPVRELLYAVDKSMQMGPKQYLSFDAKFVVAQE